MEAEKIKAVVEQYISGVSARDSDTIRKIFAADARVEDPVGTTAHQGMDAVVAFYEAGSFTVGASLALSGALCCAANTVAFPFIATVDNEDGSQLRMNVTDVFEFNDNYEIESMKAYWGPDNQVID
jgi:steroid Delta-isomerase